MSADRALSADRETSANRAGSAAGPTSAARATLVVCFFHLSLSVLELSQKASITNNASIT
ncbi:MAG TPA: hypothetical protein V6D13_03925 [Halomicronema sp.]